VVLTKANRKRNGLERGTPLFGVYEIALHALAFWVRLIHAGRAGGVANWNGKIEPYTLTLWRGKPLGFRIGAEAPLCPHIHGKQRLKQTSGKAMPHNAENGMNVAQLRIALDQA
jgi:hypothetical protein